MTLKNNLHIVRMEYGHLPQVAELEKQCFSQPWTQAMLREELDNEFCEMLVAQDEDECVAGYCGVQMITTEAYITNVAVSPDMRRRGIARALVKRMIDMASERGMDFITLEVRTSNSNARALYESLGFSCQGLRKRYYTNPSEDALIMTLNLGAQD